MFDGSPASLLAIDTAAFMTDPISIRLTGLKRTVADLRDPEAIYLVDLVPAARAHAVERAGTVLSHDTSKELRPDCPSWYFASGQQPRSDRVCREWDQGPAVVAAWLGRPCSQAVRPAGR